MNAWGKVVAAALSSSQMVSLIWGGGGGGGERGEGEGGRVLGTAPVVAFLSQHAEKSSSNHYLTPLSFNIFVPVYQVTKTCQLLVTAGAIYR